MRCHFNIIDFLWNTEKFFITSSNYVQYRIIFSNDNKMKKTLDGKQAGLQDAKQLVKENQEFKRREDQMFRKVSFNLLFG